MGGRETVAGVLITPSLAVMSAQGGNEKWRQVVRLCGCSTLDEADMEDLSRLAHLERQVGQIVIAEGAQIRLDRGEKGLHHALACSW